MIMCILPFHHVNVANPSLIFRNSVPASCWAGDKNSTIVARPEEKYSDSRPLREPLPKIKYRFDVSSRRAAGAYTVQLDKIDARQN